MRFNIVRYTKDLFHKIIDHFDKNSQDSLRHALFLFTGSIGGSKIKAKRNFIALANDIQEILGNSHTVPKFRHLSGLDVAEKWDLDLRLTCN